MKLKVAGIQKDSIVDGPGVRLSVYVQGCSHRCPGCHNPETHDPGGGFYINAGDIAEMIDSCRNIDGVTISGGEPFEQPAASAELARAVTARGLDLVIYSGYYFEELLAKSASDPGTKTLLCSGSLLVDGPFVLAEQDYNLAYRGSRNQRLIALPRSVEAGKPVEWTSRQNCINY